MPAEIAQHLPVARAPRPTDFLRFPHSSFAGTTYDQPGSRRAVRLIHANPSLPVIVVEDTFFAEPAEPAPAAAEPSPSPAPAPEQRLAEDVDYPGQPAATREAPPERQSFRSVLRRATA